MNRYHIVKGVLGGSDVYDSDGNKVGYSLPSILGDGEDFYDVHGNLIGQSFDSAFGEAVFSGDNTYGFLDREIFMGRNMYLNDDPFSKEDPYNNTDNDYNDSIGNELSDDGFNYNE